MFHTPNGTINKSRRPYQAVPTFDAAARTNVVGATSVQNNNDTFDQIYAEVHQPNTSTPHPSAQKQPVPPPVPASVQPRRKSSSLPRPNSTPSVPRRDYETSQPVFYTPRENPSPGPLGYPEVKIF